MPGTPKGRRDLTLESNQAGRLSAGNGLSMTWARSGFPPFSLKRFSKEYLLHGKTHGRHLEKKSRLM